MSLRKNNLGHPPMGNLKKTVLVSAAIGFLVPIGWQLFDLVMFAGRDMDWLLDLEHMTCPFSAFQFFYFRVPGGDLWFPFFNAALYAALALAGVTAWKWLRPIYNRRTR